ncbi:hypothetical protein EMA8858_00348 [Emticicia aquatica]|uniref:M23ase beta-sheet core domain-containing protein n=1 Tax=Emticicia aquatica TaxID=1681835 RepID=A0ABM9AKJ9_9BACT|nr:RHS repeat-associated core domain-containing protein [Emticicia aquatica]CAH0994239.1 hypothetical protein EMA8858_00348 [Emticicia aquatica]
MSNSRVACRCVEKPTATTTTDAAYLPVESLTEHYEPWGASIAADILPVPLPTLPNALPSINTPQNRFTYNGKELQTDIGLFEYGFRWYDPMNARFTSVDPMTEKMPSWSSYIYAFDNPIKYIDYNGLIPIPVNKLFKGMAHRIDSWFGPRNTGLSYASKFHKGLDINFGGGRADYGAPVLGTHDGSVSIKDNLNGNEGRMVTVTSPDGKFRTRYLHLSAINVEDGQEITEAIQVGEIGGSRKGKEFGGQVHLHYQIEKVNEETGEFEPYNPTEGKEKKKVML